MIVYDYLRIFGGAERTLARLTRDVGPVDLLVAGSSEHPTLSPLVSHANIINLGLRANSPIALALRTAPTLKKALRQETESKRYLFSGAYSPAAATALPHQAFAAYYGFSIPRFAYDLFPFYWDSLPRWQRPPFKALAKRTRSTFCRGIERMDELAVISQTVKRRLHDHLGKTAQVILPPCDLQRFQWQPSEGFFLSTARLETYKNVDIVIAAFKKMPEQHLVVASSGSDETRLRQLAKGADNIQFTGWVGDEEKASLISTCTATVYLARDEDYGLSPIESMAAGKPVIGLAEGGVSETVIDGETGYLVSPDTLSSDAVCDRVYALSQDHALGMKNACQQRATRFAGENFSATLEKLWRG